MSIIRPKFIALDSSHLATLAGDLCSSDGERRKAAAAFLETLTNCNGILLLCWHHFEELLRHGDDAVVDQRVKFFRSLPIVASIAPVTGDDAPGSIVDIFAFEVAEAFKDPDANTVTIRDRVRQKLFRCQTGEKAVGPFAAYLGPMREEFRRREETSREIVAISQSTYLGVGKTKMAGWLKGQWRSPEDAERRVTRMTELLADDVGQRGDKRIADPSAVAMQFMETVRAEARKAQRADEHPAAIALLPKDVDSSEIGAEMTLDQLGDLAAFRRQLRSINDILGLPWFALTKRVSETRLPSGLIQSTLRRHRQDLPERKGSELNDRYLVCLAPYADVTYVDKRTHEWVTRARRASPEFAGLVHRVEKASGHAEIMRQLLS